MHANIIGLGRATGKSALQVYVHSWMTQYDGFDIEQDWVFLLRGSIYMYIIVCGFNLWLVLNVKSRREFF